MQRYARNHFIHSFFFFRLTSIFDDVFELHRDWREYEVDEVELNEFPLGWEQRVTPSGVPYFVDHINRTTTVRAQATALLLTGQH